MSCLIRELEHPMFPFLHVLWAIWCKKSLLSNTKMLFQIDKWFDATKLKRPFQVGAYNKTDLSYNKYNNLKCCFHNNFRIKNM